MNFNSTEITVPSNLWSASDDSVRVLKVILRGTNANKVPYEVFINALKDNGIFVNDDITDIHVNISETQRKRTVRIWQTKIQTQTNFQYCLSRQ